MHEAEQSGPITEPLWNGAGQLPSWAVLGSASIYCAYLPMKGITYCQGETRHEILRYLYLLAGFGPRTRCL